MEEQGEQTKNSQGSVTEALRSATSLHQGGVYPSGWNPKGMSLFV